MRIRDSILLLNHNHNNNNMNIQDIAPFAVRTNIGICARCGQKNLPEVYHCGRCFRYRCTNCIVLRPTGHWICADGHG